MTGIQRSPVPYFRPHRVWCATRLVAGMQVSASLTSHPSGLRAAPPPRGAGPRSRPPPPTMRRVVVTARPHRPPRWLPPDVCAATRDDVASAAFDGDADAALPSIYSASANAAYWSSRPVACLARGLEVGGAFVKWALITRPAAPDGGAAALRETLVTLGAFFVKVGQALASRPDLLPPAFTRELEKLQDRIPPFSDNAARALIAAELGVASPDTIFSSLTPTPVAAASLGQVYRGIVWATGQQVAVKVQRPGVASAVARDAFLLRGAASFLRSARRVNTDLPALVDEWAASLFRELDYRREAEAGAEFKRLYGELEGVYVPSMLPELTTRRVLVMEWVDGTRLRSAGDVVEGGGGGGNSGAPFASTPANAAADLALVDVGVRCSLEQMLECGFFHSDPHPGNLLRTRDGKLAYLDFGMTGSVTAETR